MRPKKLTLSAFGSYAGEHTLDMDLLGKSGIYLITGRTGHGKTTIFDAVCYALYGTASGELRTPGSLRSKYALPQTQTFAELVFEHEGKTYRIRRWPDQLRPKKHTEGMTTLRAGVEYELPDGRIETKIAAVSEEITELLGLDLAQFRSVSMIAQGEFRRLISASTEDRIGIFRGIFGTSVYEKIQNRLSEDSSAVSKRLELLNERRRQYIREITAAQNSPLRLEAENAGKTGGIGIPTEQALDLIGRILEEDRIWKREVERRILEAEKRRSRAEADRRILEDRKAWEEGKRGSEKRRDALLEQKRVEEAGKEAHDAGIPAMNEEKERLISLRNMLPEYKVLDALTESSLLLGHRIGKLEQKDKLLTSGGRETGEKLQALKEEQEALAGAGAGLVRQQGEESRLKTRLESLQELSDMAQTVRRLDETAKDSERKYLQARAEAEKLSSIYTGLYGRYLDEQAGILADRLREDPSAPCPVCGSVDHPHLAEKSDQAPDRETVDGAKLRADAAGAEREKASGKCAEDRAALEAGVSRLTAGVQELFQDGFLQAAEGIGKERAGKEEILERVLRLEQMLKTEKEKTKESLTQAQAMLRILEQKERRHRELPELIRQHETEKRRLETELSQTKIDIGKMLSQKENEEKQRDVLAAKLICPSGKEALEQISRMQAELEKFEKEGLRITQELTRIEKEIAAAEGEIRTFDDQLQKAECPDAAEVNDRMEKIGALLGQLSSEKEGVDYRLSRNCEIRDRIAEVSGEYDTVEKRGRMIRALSDTANGKLAQKEKMKLETYVLGFYFDKVLVKANQRFQLMTDNQYQLVRGLQAENMRSQTGLDLDVIDRYNGSRRSVSSLSGGEAFEAALALALGFSDAIQASLGGIRLDTMFVDEGFGSLDEEVTDRTMKALNHLASGDVLVGLISHIPGIKARVLKQIIVEKDENGTGGSRARIEIS